MENVTKLKNAKAKKGAKQIHSVILDNLQPLRRFAYSLTNDMHDADDLLQKVIEKLLKKPVPADIAPLPWMFKVCKNAWIDEIRSRNVRLVASETELETLADNKDVVEQYLMHRDLQKAVQALPDNYRTVISMVVIGGMSYSETAEALEIPIGTVMSRIARARKQLAETFHNT